jgi:hypothetical protein
MGYEISPLCLRSLYKSYKMDHSNPQLLLNQQRLLLEGWSHFQSYISVAKYLPRQVFNQLTVMSHVPFPVSMLCHRTVNSVLMISTAGQFVRWICQSQSPGIYHQHRWEVL